MRPLDESVSCLFSVGTDCTECRALTFFFDRSRLNLELGGADTDMGGSPPSLDPPRTAQDHVEAIEECRADAQLTVAPSKNVGRWDWNDENSAPGRGAHIAVSPMRPSKKRASSAGQESDNEPDGAWPDELEKQGLVAQSNREGEVRGGFEGKEIQGTRGVTWGEKALVAPLKKPREASSSLALTRRLKAKAVRESPRVRKLRDKLGGRVGSGRKRGVLGGTTVVSRGGRSTSDACGFRGNVGASTTPNVAMVQGKGSDRAPLDETAGGCMPYSGDNVSFVFSWLRCKSDHLKSDEMTFNYAPAF